MGISSRLEKQIQAVENDADPGLQTRVVQGALVGAICSGVMLAVLPVVQYLMDFSYMDEFLFEGDAILFTALETISMFVHLTIQNLWMGLLCGYLSGFRPLFKHRFLIIPVVSLIAGFLSFVATPRDFAFGNSFGTPASTVTIMVINGLLFVALYYTDLRFKKSAALLK